MGFSTAIEDVADHYLSIFVIGFYILGSLQEGRELIIVATQILSVELLIPLHLALLKTLYVLRASSLGFLSTLFHRSQRCSLFLWRELRQKQGKVLFDCTQQAYVYLALYYQENSNACKTILDKITDHIFFILFLEYMDKFWILVYQWTEIMIKFSVLKQVKIWLGFQPPDVIQEPYVLLLLELEQTSDLASAYCKKPSPRFHLRQIPGRAHKVKGQNQEL